MEPRAALGDYDEGTDVITLYTTSQNPHLARVVLSAFQGVAPENKLRVIAPDVGGGFGSKIFVYNEETVCAWAAKKIKRPVKWTAERTEVFPDGRTRPRSCLACRAGSRRQRQDSRPAGAHDRQPRRVSCRHFGRWCRRGCMRRSCLASTPSPQSTPRSTGSIRTPRRSTRCAALAGLRRPSWSSASSKRPPGKPDTIRQSFVARISSPRSLIRPRSSSPTMSATMRRRSTRRLRLLITRAFPRARRPPPPKANCGASDFPPISRPAALRPLRRRALSEWASGSGNRPRCA